MEELDSTTTTWPENLSRTRIPSKQLSPLLTFEKDIWLLIFLFTLKLFPQSFPNNVPCGFLLTCTIPVSLQHWLPKFSLACKVAVLTIKHGTHSLYYLHLSQKLPYLSLQFHVLYMLGSLNSYLSLSFSPKYRSPTSCL